MDISGDELAGVVDLFGAVTREELGSALAELAYKHGDEHDPAAFDSEINQAILSYHLISVDTAAISSGAVPEGASSVFLPGPVAFPELPERGRDLRHILSIEPRDIDRTRATEDAIDLFEADVIDAIETNDSSRQQRLLDISYELETWADIDLSEQRSQLESE